MRAFQQVVECVKVGEELVISCLVTGVKCWMGCCDNNLFSWMTGIVWVAKCPVYYLGTFVILEEASNYIMPELYCNKSLWKSNGALTECEIAKTSNSKSALTARRRAQHWPGDRVCSNSTVVMVPKVHSVHIRLGESRLTLFIQSPNTSP